MILTPEEIKVVKSMLAPAVQNGLIDAKHLNELLVLASGVTTCPEALSEVYTVRQAAELIHCHPKSVWRYIREGKLHTIKIGIRAVRIPRASLEQFLAG